MPDSNTPIVDPTGQPLVNFLSDQGVSAEDAYNVVQGVREMAGERVIAEIRAQGAETRAQEAETRALVAETRSEIASLASRVDANTARLDAMGWAVSATLALVAALAVAGLLNWVTGLRADSRSARNQSSGDGSS